MTASARLSWRDHDLCTPPSVTLFAGYAVRLGAGIPLARDAARDPHPVPRPRGPHLAPRPPARSWRPRVAA